MMAVILLRMVVVLLASLVAFVAGLVLVGIGQGGNAAKVVTVCAIVAWFAMPNPDDRAAFDRFQKERLARLGIEI